MSTYKPYTYLIGWSKENKWYYGVRFALNCNPNDFWKKYFTSSKYVEESREQYGDPDVIQIRKIFNDRESAMNWEYKVLRRMKVVGDPKWLNMCAGKCIDPDSFREIARARMSSEKNPMKNEKIKCKVACKLSKTNKLIMSGMRPSERSIKYGNFKEKNPFYGKKHSTETIDKIRYKNSKEYMLIHPDATEERIKNLNQYCKDNNLNRDALMESANLGTKVDIPKSKRKPTATRYNTVGFQLVKLN